MPTKHTNHLYWAVQASPLPRIIHIHGSLNVVHVMLTLFPKKFYRELLYPTYKEDHSMLKKAFKLITIIISTLFMALIVFLGVASYTDYKPSAIETISITNPQTQLMEKGKPFSITTFNIGYAGLDATQDFFMDGGRNSRATNLATVNDNLNAITETLQELESDIYLLQEVDINSSRSFHLNQVESLAEAFPHHSYTFGYNYKALWVPVPVFKPMGKAESGLQSFSSFEVASQTRLDLPGKESWPVQLFELDRAVVEHRIHVSEQKELVLLNIHLSAFDKGGTIRKQQLDFLKQYIQHEIEKDNYIIVGGDWNHVLPSTDPAVFATTQQWPEWLYEFPADFAPVGFQWAVEPNIPTVRTLDIPYEQGVNFLAVIDGFLVSPNVEILDVSTSNLDFANSDHHPVTATFILN